MLMVKGEICTEDLGGCDVDCSLRCESTHPGGKPSCAVNNNYPACRCYKCAPPPPPPVTKRCRFSLGIWGVGCSDRDCDWQCNVNYPGLVLERGFCLPIAAPQYTSFFCVIMLGLRTIVVHTISEVLGSVPFFFFL